MQPGDIKSFKGRRADRAGKTIHVVLIERREKTRWRAWAWDQETPEGKWYRGGCITVSEHMIDPSQKRPRKATKEEYFRKGTEAWDAIDEAKSARKAKRRERVQDRYEANKERGTDRLVKGNTYHWPADPWYKSGQFTGEIENGKAKMQPGSPGWPSGWAKRGRPVWILLDRLFEERDGRYWRVQY